MFGRRRREERERSAFGYVLYEKRRAAKLSQTQLADRLGLDQTYVSHLELGTKRPSVDVLHALARELNMNVTYLFSLLDSDNPEDATDILREHIRTVPGVPDDTKAAMIQLLDDGLAKMARQVEEERKRLHDVPFFARLVHYDPDYNTRTPYDVAITRLDQDMVMVEMMDYGTGRGVANMCDGIATRLVARHNLDPQKTLWFIHNLDEPRETVEIGFIWHEREAELDPGKTMIVDILHDGLKPTTHQIADFYGYTPQPLDTTPEARQHENTARTEQR